MLGLELLEGGIELVMPGVQNEYLEAQGGRGHAKVGDGNDAGEPSHDEEKKGQVNRGREILKSAVIGTTTERKQNK